MSDNFITKEDCKDFRDTVDKTCKERFEHTEKDVDNLGESHRRLEDKLDKLNDRITSVYRAIAVMAVGLLGTMVGVIAQAVMK